MFTVAECAADGHSLCNGQGNCVAGSYNPCDCYDGYEGTECATEIDECDQDWCGPNSVSCVDEINDVTCTCNDDYWDDYCDGEYDILLRNKLSVNR